MTLRVLLPTVACALTLIAAIAGIAWFQIDRHIDGHLHARAMALARPLARQLTADSDTRAWQAILRSAIAGPEVEDIFVSKGRPLTIVASRDPQQQGQRPSDAVTLDRAAQVGTGVGTWARGADRYELSLPLPVFAERRDRRVSNALVTVRLRTDVIATQYRAWFAPAIAVLVCVVLGVAGVLILLFRRQIIGPLANLHHAVETGDPRTLAAESLAGRDDALGAIYRSLRDRHAEHDLDRRRQIDFARGAADWFWECDAENAVTFIQSASDPLADTMVEAALGTDIFDHLQAAHGLPDLAPLRRMMARREEVRDLTLVVEPAAAATPACRVNALPLYTPSGQFGGYRGSVSSAEDVPAVSSMNTGLPVDAVSTAAANLTQEAIECLPQGIALFDGKGELLLWNKTYALILGEIGDQLCVGTTYEEILRATLETGLHGDLGGEIEAVYQERLARSRNEADVIDTVAVGDACYRLREYRLPDQSLLVVGTEAPAQKQETQAGKQQASLPQTALDHLGHGVIVVDRNQTVTYANASATDILAVPAALLAVGSPFRDLIVHRVERGDFGLGNVAQVVEEVASQAHEATPRAEICKAGETRTLSTVRHVVPEVGIAHVFSDITEQNAGVYSETHARQALESVSQGLAYWNAHDELVFWNDRFREFSGVAAESLKPGLKYIEFLMVRINSGGVRIPKSHASHWIQAQLKRRKKPHSEIEGQYRGKWLRTVDQRLPDGGMLTTVSDIGDLKTREQEAAEAAKTAEAANQAKSEFLATVSHEIRTPMNGVLATAGLLSASELSDEQRRFVETITFSGQSLLAILNDILDLSRIEAGNLELDVTDFNIHTLLDGISALWQSRIVATGLHYSLSVDENVPAVLQGDPGRIRQILFNLIGNAAKFTEAGTISLQVAVERESEDGLWLKFSITDTGIGIEPAMRGRLFDKFTQADASAARKYGGTGLGLAICRNLVALLDGEIHVESKPGQGSTFWFTARCARGSPNAVDDHALLGIDAAGQHLGERHLRVLVAEDHHVNQMIIKAVLSRAGHHADLVTNGLEAISALMRAPYDLVLMDVQMPEMDGLATTQRLRAMGGQFADIPIIALTANTMAGDRDRYLEAGMNEYVSKPIDTDHLFSVIRRICGDDVATYRPVAAPQRPDHHENPAKKSGRVAERALDAVIASIDSGN